MKRGQKEFVLVLLILIVASVFFASQQGSKQSFEKELISQAPTAQVVRFDQQARPPVQESDIFVNLLAKDQQRQEIIKQSKPFIADLNAYAKQSNPYS